jgi:hypothetical protein
MVTELLPCVSHIDAHPERFQDRLTMSPIAGQAKLHTFSLIKNLHRLLKRSSTRS